MDRRAPIILLIEDDDADRLTLTRMLGECGYKVMAVSRGAGALNTFVIHHRHIALVLLSEQLSDQGSAGLVDALYRIDQRMPVFTARYPSRGLSAGKDAERSLAFAELIGEVQRRLRRRPVAKRRPSAVRTDSTAVPAVTFFAGDSIRSSRRLHRQVHWPLRDQEVDEIESGGPIEGAPVTRELVVEREVRTQELRSDPLMSLATPDRQRYLARNRERALRQRIARIGITVAGSALIVTTLLEMRATTARAISEDGTITVPLAATPISERVGIVHLVSAARAHRSNLADDLLRRSRRDDLRRSADTRRWSTR